MGKNKNKKNVFKMTNVQVSRKEFETYLRIKKYKYEDLVRPTHSSLIIQSEEMEPREYNSLSDAASGIGVSSMLIRWNQSILHRVA